MSNTANDSSAGIHCIALQKREQATFDRVIALNNTQGLTTHNYDDMGSAALIIVTQENFSQLETSSQHTVIVVASQPNCVSGDFHVTRPLLIEHVANTLSEALKHHKIKHREKKATVTNELEELKKEILEDLESTHYSSRKCKH